MPASNEVRAMQALLAKASKAREEHSQKWTENLDFIKGEQTLGITGTRADTQTNFLFAQMMTIIPILANRLPEVKLTPISESQEFAQISKLVSSLINRIFRRNDLVKRQQELVTNGLFMGPAYMKPVWNQKLLRGLGDFEIKIPDTRSIYKEPGKMRIRGESNWVHEVRRIDKMSLLRLYPKKRKEINRAFSRGESLQSLTPVEGTNTGEIGHHAASATEFDATGARTTSEAFVFDVALNADNDKPFVDLVESWFLDETMVDEAIKEEGVDPNKPTKKVPAFPTGRLIVWTGDEKLDDRKNPFPWFPYLEYENYHIPGEQYAMSEIEQLKPLQDQFNRRMNQLMDSMNFANHKMMFYDHSAGLDPDEITNEPGGIYPVADVNGIKIIDYGGPNRAQFDSLVMMQRLIEVISGVREVTQGEVPGDVRSGFAVEQLQEAAQTRLRMKTRILEDAVTALAKSLTDMIGLFYIPTVHYEAKMDLQGITHDIFDYEVRAGISLPQSKLAEQQKVQWAFTQGLTGPEYTARTLEFPNIEQLVKDEQARWDALIAAQTGQQNQGAQ